MKIEHTIQLTAEADVVWDWVSSIVKVAECIPGVEDMQEIESNKRYAATVKERIGPFKVAFPMELELVESNKPSMKIKAYGIDKFTKTQVHLDMFVTVQKNSNTNGTELELIVDYQMKGKLATLGQGMVNRKFTEIVEGFAKNLTNVLEGGSQDARVL